MATEINKIVLKRGTTAKAVVYTGPVGEVVVDTDLRSLRVQDNVTPGGVLLSKEGHGHAIAGGGSAGNEPADVPRRSNAAQHSTA